MFLLLGFTGVFLDSNASLLGGSSPSSSDSTGEVYLLPGTASYSPNSSFPRMQYLQGRKTHNTHVQNNIQTHTPMKP